MATWNKPASNWGNMSANRNYGKSSSASVTSIANASWRNVPWAELYRMCEDEQTLAVATAKAERQEMYDRFIDKKLAVCASINPEAGAYEGNITDEYPIGPVPDLFRIKRTASNAAIEEFIEAKNIASISLVIMPQIIEHIATFKLTTVSGEAYSKEKASTAEGLISAAALYRAYFTDEASLGLYNFLMMDSRSKYLTTQYKAPARNYCALVPLIMYAFKLKLGIPYSHWDRQQIRGVTNVKLADAMLYVPEVELTVDQILEARNEGLMTKSGPKTGQLRNPSYTYKLYGKTLLSDAPEYAQVMAAQIWCAHPENRTKYMVLDPSNWDGIPAPLVTSEVLRDTGAVFTNRTVVANSDEPWA